MLRGGRERENLVLGEVDATIVASADKVDEAEDDEDGEDGECGVGARLGRALVPELAGCIAASGDACDEHQRACDEDSD